MELVCEVGAQTYALEHTVLEPFTGHMQINAEARRKIQPLVDAVMPLLPGNPDEEFELQVPFDGLMHLFGKRLDAVHRDLARWVTQAAPSLPVAPFWRNLATENSDVEVYLVMTCIDHLWRVFPLRIDRKTYVDTDPMERASEVDPGTLIDLIYS